MRALAYNLALLVALVPLTRTYKCPAQCECERKKFLSMQCEFTSGYTFTYEAYFSWFTENRYNYNVELNCKGKTLNSSNLYSPVRINSKRLSIFNLTSCQLGDSLVKSLAALNVTSASTLVLTDPIGELLAEHVHGLGELTYFFVKGLGKLNTMPEKDSSASFSIEPHVFSSISVEYLHLEFDVIGELHEKVFHGLNKLEGLSIISKNASNYATAGSFKDLTAVKWIDLSGLQQLPSSLFRNKTRLTSVTITNSRIEQLSPDLFLSKRLRMITITNNIGVLTLQPRIFADLAILRVYVTNCSVPQLPPDVFDGSTELNVIEMANNSISELPPEVFYSQAKVHTLNLQNNKIRQLPSTVFSGMFKLKHIYLDGNLVEVLPEYIFANLKSLETVSIRNNRLRKISVSAFFFSDSIKSLSFSDNALNQDFMKLLTIFEFNLETLDVSGNNISNVFSANVEWAKSLDIYNFSKNNIKTFTISDFADYHATIDLSYNKITTLWENENKYKATLYNHATILLQGNPFVCDCYIYPILFRASNYDTSRSLKTSEPIIDFGDARCAQPSKFANKLLVDLSLSALTCPVKKCLTNCSCYARPSTSRIEINCTSMPEIPELYYKNIELRLLHPPISLQELPASIISLHLDGIDLREAPSSVPSTLLELDLARNRLTQIPMELLKSNLNLSVSGNPLNCDCSYKEFVTALQQSYEENKIMDADNVTCVDQQRLPIDITKLCSVPIAEITAGFFIFLALLIVITTAFAYRYSLEIRVYMYSQRWLQWLIREEDVDRDKLYDAFVSFSHQDTRFVVEQLLPQLETGPQPFKLCVHYRDWQLGEWIPAQIAHSVEQSRRTIIVLSKHFLTSVWGILEFRVAHLRAQQEKRIRLIIILMEDVQPDEVLDAELHAYLSTNTYVKWGDPWFWKKLRYALGGGRIGKKATGVATEPEEEIVLQELQYISEGSRNASALIGGQMLAICDVEHRSS